MEKVSSVLAFRGIGQRGINPFADKPSYQDPELVFKRNYFVVQDTNLDGSAVFLYYPLKLEVLGNRLVIQKFPANLMNGVIMFGKNQGVVVSAYEISRGKIVITNRVEPFDQILERVSQDLPRAPEPEVIPDILAEVSVLAYTLNPRQYWRPYERT